MLLAAMRRADLDEELCSWESGSDRTIRFALLERNQYRFNHRQWTVSGRAIQVQDTADGGTFLLVTLDSDLSQIIAVFTYRRPADSVVSNRRVRIYGRVAGTYTYETQGGQERTVPRVNAVHVMLHEASPDCSR